MNDQKLVLIAVQTVLSQATKLTKSLELLENELLTIRGSSVTLKKFAAEAKAKRVPTA